jgi:hypothetical protein
LFVADLWHVKKAPLPGDGNCALGDNELSQKAEAEIWLKKTFLKSWATREAVPSRFDVKESIC